MPAATDATVRTEPRIVEDCPVCFRVIWGGSRCYHGAVPPPEEKDKDHDGTGTVLKGGTDHRGRKL